jgi:hypothetical protein
MLVAICANKDNRVVALEVVMGKNNGDEAEKHSPHYAGRIVRRLARDSMTDSGPDGRYPSIFQKLIIEVTQ